MDSCLFNFSTNLVFANIPQRSFAGGLPIANRDNSDKENMKRKNFFIELVHINETPEPPGVSVCQTTFQPYDRKTDETKVIYYFY